VLNMATRNMWTRRRDLVYLVFFVIHIPIMLGSYHSYSSYLPLPFSSDVDLHAQHSHLLLLSMSCHLCCPAEIDFAFFGQLST